MRRKFHDGRDDGLIPLKSLDPTEIHSFSDLLEAMGRTSFGGRRLGEAFHIMKEMIADPDCYVVATFSGAMTIAKMGLIICKMIDHGMINAVVSTGALIAHGLSESVGCVHYKADPGMPDSELYLRGYNRVYDTIEMETNFTEVERAIGMTLERLPKDFVLSTESLNRELGRTLAESFEGEGILKSAYLSNVPVFIPAFTDSEIALDISTWSMLKKIAKRREAGLETGPALLSECLNYVPRFNPYLDLNSYVFKILSKKTLGIFTIGGGVPRNWAQQIGPYVEIANTRLGIDCAPPRFKYGVRICPEPDYWGGLSGCTYSEGTSWGKFIPKNEGGRYAEVLTDATVVWPLLVKGLLEVIPKGDQDRRG